MADPGDARQQAAERDEFLRDVVEQLAPANGRWPGLWTRLESLLNEADDLRERERLLLVRVQEAERALREAPLPLTAQTDLGADEWDDAYRAWHDSARAVLGGDVQEQEPLLMVSPLAAHAMQKYCGGEFFEAHVDGGPDFRFGGLAVKVMRDWNDWTPGG